MRTTTHPVMFVFGMALTAVLTLGALSPNVVAQEAALPESVKQIALTDAQINDFIVAQKEIGPIIAKAPQGDQADPKVMEQLETVAKKHKFANYDDYDDVAENIGLVMSGIDPETKKYVGAEAVIKKEIASVDSEKLAPNDKKGQLDELQSELKEPAESVKFPAKYRSRGEELRQACRLHAANPVKTPPRLANPSGFFASELAAAASRSTSTALRP